MPLVTIPITREGTTPEQEAALIKGATDLLADVLNKPPALTFVVIQEVEMEEWGVDGLPAAEHRSQAAARSPGEPVGQRLFHLAPEAGDQFGHGRRASERSALSGPLGPVPELPCRLCGGMQRLPRVVSDRVVRDRSLFDANTEGCKAVGEAAGRAARDRRRHHGVFRGRAEERGPVARVGRRLRTGDECSAELCGGRAERERRGDPGPVHDPAGRDHRDVELFHQKSGQGHRPEPIIRPIGVEHPAMSARFIPLGNDGIDPGSGYGLPLFETRGRCEEHDPGSAEGLDPIAGGQAEVEADDRRAFGQQNRELGVVGQEGLIDLRQAGRRFRPYRANSGPSRASHAASRAASAAAGWLQNTLTLNGRSVLDRTAAIICRVVSASTDPTPMEPSPPAFDTAAAISGVDTPAIGACMIGSSIPSLRRNGSKGLLLRAW